MRTFLTPVTTSVTFVAVLLALAASPAVADKKSITYESHLGPVLSRTAAAPGDRPDHEIVQTTRQDMTFSADPDWNEVPLINYSQSDLVAGNGTVAGYAIRTHRNGDKSFYSYQGRLRVVAEDGVKHTVGEGTVNLIGGTGKFANAKGTGTWKSAKGGVATIRMDVEY